MRRTRPPPRLTVSQWADRYRHLSPEASAEPGKWHTDRAEYQRGILDAVSDSTVETVVVMSSAQVGKTEIINNLCGYHIDQDPAPSLIIQPTVEMGEAWSRDRLAPMLRDTPVLREKVCDVRSRDSGNTLRQKNFPGGHLTIAGANSAASLAARPIRVLCCDEVDRYPSSAGTEGDPVSLGIKRTTTFWNRKIVLVSTPTVAGVSRIAAAYDESDQRRYWVPCPHCDEMQVLRWPQVRWDADDAATAAYHCVGCDLPWTDAERWAAVGQGEWRASLPFRGTAGFHLNELLSPWRRLAQTARDFLDAQRGGVERLKTFVNTALGEVWQERGEAPEWERLIERREPFPMGEVPPGAVVLTAGVDVQPDRIECDVWAWGQGYESWLVETKVLSGDPTLPDVWADLRAALDRTWFTGGGDPMRVAKIGVDTGGKDTQATYRALRAWADARVVPLKGLEGWNRTMPVAGPVAVDVTADGRKLRGGLKLWTVAVSTLKAEFYRQLWLSRGDDVAYPPGWVHLPLELSVENVKQLVAEQLVIVNDRRGFPRQEWRPVRARNERLDCRNYARAALSVLGADRYGDRFWTMWKRPRAFGPNAHAPSPEAEAATAASIAASPAASLDAPAPVAPVSRPPAPPAAPVRRVGRSSYLGRIGR